MPNGFRFHKRQRRKALCGTTLIGIVLYPLNRLPTKPCAVTGTPGTAYSHCFRQNCSGTSSRRTCPLPCTNRQLSGGGKSRY